MKVLLISPYIHASKVTPLHGRKHGDNEMSQENREDFIASSALIYLASLLRKNNHEPILIDLNCYKTHRQLDPKQYSKELIIESIVQHEPELVGINCLFSGMFPIIMELIVMIKARFHNIKIVIGGIHPTTFPKEILKNIDELDYVVIGEGDTILVELANHIEGRNGSDITKIQSIAYRDTSGSVVINSRQSFIEDLDEIPIPAWDLLDFDNYKGDLSYYFNPKQHEITMRAPILTSRACPYNCNFCNMHSVMGKKLRRRNPKAVVSEMEFLNRTYGVNYFSFMDDNLALSKGHILSLCQEIKNSGLDIQFDTPNGVCLNTLDEDVVAALSDAGLVKTSLAIEHGSDYIRNEVIGKRLSREKISEVVSLCKKYRIKTAGYFIIGFPEETCDTLKDQYELMSQLDVDIKRLFSLVPFPGTRLFQQVVDDNLFSSKVNLADLWKKPVSLVQDDFLISPYDLSIEELIEFQSKFNYKSQRFESPWEDMLISK